MARLVVAPDGGTFRVDAGGVDVPARWSFISWLDAPTGRTRLNTGVAGANEAFLDRERQHTHVDLSEATYDGHRLLAMTYRGPGQTQFVWQGPYHECYLTRGGIGILIERFVDFLRPLRLVDSPTGLRITPRPGAGTEVVTQLGMALLPDVAGMELFSTSRISHSLPKRAGKTVRGGELWRIEDGQGGALLIANDTATVRLRALDGRLGAALDLAETVLVAHQPR